MLTIRLTRVGKKKQPSYRVVVQENRKDPWGDYLELLGHYDPLAKPPIIALKEDRIRYWIEKGAQPSDTVWNILVERGIVSGEKRRIVAISRKRAAKLGSDAKAKIENAAAAP